MNERLAMLLLIPAGLLSEYGCDKKEDKNSKKPAYAQCNATDEFVQSSKVNGTSECPQGPVPSDLKSCYNKECAIPSSGCPQGYVLTVTSSPPPAKPCINTLNWAPYQPAMEV